MLTVEDMGKEEAKTIIDLKRKIHQLKGFEIERQMLCVDSNILSDCTELIILKPDSVDFGSNANPPSTKNEEESNGRAAAEHKPFILNLKLSKGMCNLRINLINGRDGHAENEKSQLILPMYSTVSISHLKVIIAKKYEHLIPQGSDLIIFFRRKELRNEQFLFENLIEAMSIKGGSEEKKNHRQSVTTEARVQNVDNYLTQYKQNTESLRQFSFTVYLKFKTEHAPMSLCMDFRFNCLRDVKKVQWKEGSPWYREVQDGLSWFGYCLNNECSAFRHLFVVNRGYGIFKLGNELTDFSCPVCSQTNYELRNMGFVNCEWALKGALK